MSIKAARSISYQKNPLVTMKDVEEIRLRLKKQNPIEVPPPPPAPLPSPPPSLPSKQDRVANFRFALLKKLQKEISQNPQIKKGKFTKQFLKSYNSGNSLPDIFKELGQISRPTVYRWIKAYKEGDINALIPQFRGTKPSGILPGEKDFILKFLLNQNQPKISDAIRECKRYLGEHSTSGIATLRRFVNQFKIYHYDIWKLRREGEKAWNDEVAPYQDRDPMLLDVGEVIVADGHKLNLNVFDPVTGKKKRATLVLFWDWKSTYPLGWEIMFSENTQCIAVALRNALLTLGKIPSNIYIDNGRAFLAKVFTRKIRIEETEIPGMIERLGSKYRRAMPYHGQSKPIERFFLIINDRLERRLPSYTGASLKDKPAYLRRNEILAQQLHDDWTPTADDVFNIMLQWREEYIDEPRPHRRGLTARQIFDEGKGTGLDPKALCFLMMGVEIKSVRRNRFTFAGTDWEGSCLYGYKGKVLIRYSLSDLSKIYVFDVNDQYKGTVEQCGKADPIKDWQAAKRIAAERRKDKRYTKEFAAFVVEGRRNPDLIEYIETEEAKKPKLLSFSPFSDKSENPKVEIQSESETLTIQVHPESGLSWPKNLPLPDTFYERYDWYREIIKEDSKMLTDADWSWIKEYEAIPEWENFYRGYDPIFNRQKE